ncbi:MAG: 50S ribosomal protein L25 [Planctomycetota bacterium]|nr:MAG: 50S ribosomal protein L25 [Planctomycetota bacterium]
MEIVKLKVESREAKGTRAARRLRREGKLPGVVYGHNQTPENVAVNIHDLSSLLEHGIHVAELKVGESAQQVLIKEVQFDHLGATPIHVDFARVDLTEQVTVSVPLEFKGVPVGTHEGGALEHLMVDLEVKCQVTQIPESIRVNVADMKLDDVLHVRDIQLPENIVAVSSPEAIVCVVRARTAAAEAEEIEVEEEVPEQPEIIGRKEKEGKEELEGESGTGR